MSTSNQADDDARHSPSEVAAAYEECERIMRAAAKNFQYGIRLLAPEKRGALAAVYAYARRIDDIGDGTLPALEKLRLLDDARREVKAIGSDTNDPVLIALSDAAARLPIPLPAFLELIDGCELDVRGAGCPTFLDLVHYCRCVAGSIGRLSTGVFEASDPVAADPLADTLGVALQLTNILRDIREDLHNGRVYLPQDELTAAGVTLRLDNSGNVINGADGTDAISRAKLLSLIREQAARAEKWYVDGLQLLPMLDARSAACCSAMAGIYHRLLGRIARDPGAVLTQRLSLPAWEKAYLAARSVVQSRR
jgi:phytoene synthase